MALDLYDFQAEVRHRGVLSTNKFNVRIDPSKDLPIGDAETLRSLSLRAVNANFPGIQLMLKDNVLRYGYGPTEKTPHNVLFSDTGLTFLVDARSRVYHFWYRWLKYIVNFDSSSSMFEDNIDPSGVNEDGQLDLSGAGSKYEVAYKDEYIADVTISPTSDLHNKSMSCILHRAYPIAIQEIPLDASAQNSPVVLHVTMAYRDHKIVNHSTKDGTVFVTR